MKKTFHNFRPLRPENNFHKLLLAMKIIAFILVCGLTLPAFSLTPGTLPSDDQQQIKVSGTITDASTGEAMAGVNIQVRGTATGAISDVSGKYTLLVTSPNVTLVFSFIGYVSQEVALGGRTTVDVALAGEVTGLEEVVVVGYSTQRKVTVTGSVVSAKGDDIKKSPAVNVSNNLIGRMPGLTAVSRSGEPGYDNSELRIRGSNTLGDNSPLIVVDGIANRGMARLNPNDIESITILKDASAAIYGSQAANGVILVTTRRGTIGKPKVTLTMNVGGTQPTRIPDMADAATYSEMLNEIAYYKAPNLGRYQKYSEEDLQKFRDGSDPWGHPNTDWFHEVFKPWSMQNQVNASISGGTDNMKYFLSLGTRYQDAVYYNSATNYKQYDFRTNIDGKVSKSIDIAFDVAGRQEDRNFPTRSAGSIFRMLMRGKPNMPAYWPNGDPGPDIEYGDNPAVTSTSATGYDRDKWYILESNLRANIIIPWIKGLMFTANASFDKAIRFQKRFETPWYLYTWDGNANHITTKGKRGLDAPQLSERMEDGQKITINAFATYERLFAAKHNIKVLAGTERRSGINDVFTAFRKNYISAAVDQLFAGASDQYMANDGWASQNAYMSYFGRVNYDLSRKYLLEFVWRYDGSYKFPESKRFGFFPAVSAGWRISEENFWRNNLAFFNDFKIRGSWGQTGNDRIAEYQYLTTYGFVGGRTYVYNGADAKLLIETKIPNPNVTWEVANQANIGFDATLFNNKLTVSAEYFNNLRTQILITRNASIPSSTGLTLPPENIGKVRNAGFEGIVTYRDRSGDFDYTVSVNGSYSKNKILFWDETPGIPEYQRSTGRPMGSSLYYQATGIFNNQGEIDAYPHWAGAQPGDVIFEDVNDDGVIDGLDRVRNEKNYLPRFIYGATLSLGYKGFDLAVLIQGASGSAQYIGVESGEIGNFYQVFAENRWTPENTEATYPRTWNRDEEYWRSQGNTFWLYKTDYLRLKNFELGYTLPSGVSQKLGIEGIRFYVNGINLLTMSKQKLIDPEVESGTSYPLQRVVTGGITLTF
jgi:TonB-linked SusC/RagA family outer membrane protein